LKPILDLGFPIYEFRYPDLDKVESVLTQVEEMEYSKNDINVISEYPYYDAEMFTWFHKCLSLIRDKYYSETIDLTIVDSWANKTKMNQQHHFHHHPNSIVSGIFYLTDCESSKTLFTHPNPWFKQCIFLRFAKMDHKDRNLKLAIKPEKGKLILFPSTIFHETEVLKENIIRYSISFNTFITGYFPEVNSGLRLKITSSPIETFKKIY